MTERQRLTDDLNVPRDEVDRFIERHGGIVIYGDTADGPVYTLADGWHLWIPVDADRPAEAVKPARTSRGG